MQADTTLALQLARISRELLATPEERSTVRSIAANAPAFVPACESAVVTERLSRRLRPTVWTHTGAKDCEELQQQRGEGPTFDVIMHAEHCLVEDLAQETRWSDWAAEAHALGAGSMLGLRLCAGRETLGALSCYSSRRGAFTPTDVAMGFAYAAHASVALFGARQASVLDSAVDAKHRIGIAQGILMSRYDLSKDAAFQLLRRYSNSTNTKLRDVAERVHELGDLPPRPGHPDNLGVRG